MFHWPNMYTDIAEHCQSCEVCQKHAKANPMPYPMQEKEVVSVPSERVNFDVVGPFPKARGGVQIRKGNSAKHQKEASTHRYRSGRGHHSWYTSTNRADITASE